MDNMIATGKPKMASIEVTVFRNDGSVEHKGVVSYWHRNPLKRLLFWLKNNWRK